MQGRIRRWLDEWRPSAVTLGAPAFPLFVLFGLNAVDELDRSAFAVLLPDIRDHFDLSNAGALRLVSLTTIAVLLIEVPLSFYCDRGNRVRIATIGGRALGASSRSAPAPPCSVGMLVAMRIGAGGGRAVVTPTHSSLLSDYYEPASAVKVFSVHRQANSVGQILGPLIAGVLAAALRLRARRSSCSRSPRSCSCCSALRLREPVRGYHERARRRVPTKRPPWCADAPSGVWSTMRVLAPGADHPPDLARRPVPRGRPLRRPEPALARLRGRLRPRQRRPRAPSPLASSRSRSLGVFLAMPRVAKVAMTRPGVPAALRRHRRRRRRRAPRRPRLRPQRRGGRRRCTRSSPRPSAPSRRRSSRSSRSWRRHGCGRRPSRTISVLRHPRDRGLPPASSARCPTRLGIQASMVVLVPIAVVAELHPRVSVRSSSSTTSPLPTRRPDRRTAAAPSSPRRLE